MKGACFILLLFFYQASTSFCQQNRIKAGAIVIPSGSLFVIGDVGYERLNKALTKSWQFHINASGGEIALDAGSEKRIWGTIEKTFYKPTISKKLSWSYSFFNEVGSREKNAGKVSENNTKIFRETKQFEINIGTSLGIQLGLGKKIRLEAQAGPKLIFANGYDYFSNRSSGQIEKEKNNEIRAGLRLTGVLSYQF